MFWFGHFVRVNFLFIFLVEIFLKFLKLLNSFLIMLFHGKNIFESITVKKLQADKNGHFVRHAF